LERKVLFAALKRYANSLYKERKVQYDYKQSEYIKLEQENYYIEVHHPKADETAKIMIEEMQQYMIYAKTNNFDLPSHFEDHTADLLRQLIEMLDIDINKIDNIDEEYNLLKLKNAMIKRFGIQILLEKCIELLKVRRIAEANCQSTDLDCFKSPAYEEMLECIRHEFLDIKLESQAYFLHGWKPEALLLLELIAKDYAFQPIFANLTFTNDEPQSRFIQEDGQRIKYYNHRLTQNMIQAAIQQNGLALEHLPSQYKDDIALIQSAIQQNGLALEFAPSKYKNQRDIVLAAVQQNGTALQFASQELRNDAEILSVALQSAENIGY
jgi:hypothetical protein